MRDTNPGTIVLVGIRTSDPPAFDRMAEEFGWLVHWVSSIQDILSLPAGKKPVAILFHPSELGQSWEQALRAVRGAAPEALPIVCHGFAERVEWPILAEAGAFHSLRVPFDLSEVRQSLGFVREAAARAASISALERAPGTVDKPSDNPADNPAANLTSLRKAVGRDTELSSEMAASPGA